MGGVFEEITRRPKPRLVCQLGLVAEVLTQSRSHETIPSNDPIEQGPA